MSTNECCLVVSICFDLCFEKRNRDQQQTNNNNNNNGANSTRILSNVAWLNCFGLVLLLHLLRAHSAICHYVAQIELMFSSCALSVSICMCVCVSFYRSIFNEYFSFTQYVSHCSLPSSLLLPHYRLCCCCCRRRRRRHYRSRSCSRRLFVFHSINRAAALHQPIQQYADFGFARFLILPCVYFIHENMCINTHVCLNCYIQH